MIPFIPFLPSVDLGMDFWPVLQQDKIQHLRDAVQSITSELNGVLGLLDSLSRHQPPFLSSTPYEGLPVPTQPSLGGLRGGSSLGNPSRVAPLDRWAWSSRLSSISGDNVLAEKWHRYFPGELPGLIPPALLPAASDFVSRFQCWERWVPWCC